MSLLKRIRAAFGAQTPRDGMIDSYPPTDFEEATGLRAYPPKVLLKDQGVFAYRLEFAAFEADAARFVDALASTFNWPNRALFQNGQARRGDRSAHFSIRFEFHGAVVVTVTNSAAFIEKIDALNIEPPPPWIAFPDVDPSTLGALQGSMEYWWDWLFSPFWSALDEGQRASCLSRFPPPSEDWLEFLSAREE